MNKTDSDIVIGDTSTLVKFNESELTDTGNHGRCIDTSSGCEVCPTHGEEGGWFRMTYNNTVGRTYCAACFDEALSKLIQPLKETK